MSKNKLGLVVGLFVSLIHFVWSIAVAISPSGVQSLMNWIFKLHHLNIPVTVVSPFVFMNAVILVVITFFMGYVFGWVLAALFNLMHKKEY